MPKKTTWIKETAKCFLNYGQPATKSVAFYSRFETISLLRVVYAEFLRRIKLRAQNLLSLSAMRAYAQKTASEPSKGLSMAKPSHRHQLYNKGRRTSPSAAPQKAKRTNFIEGLAKLRSNASSRKYAFRSSASLSQVQEISSGQIFKRVCGTSGRKSHTLHYKVSSWLCRRVCASKCKWYTCRKRRSDWYIHT